MTPELRRNYGTSYVENTEVEVLPVVDLSGKSAFQFFFVGDATQVYSSYEYNNKNNTSHNMLHVSIWPQCNYEYILTHEIPAKYDQEAKRQVE